MSCREVLRRLKVLEDKVYAKLKVDESAAESMEFLRSYEEAFEKLRRDPCYDVRWEVEIAQKVVQKLVEERVL